MKPLIYYCRWQRAKLRLHGRNEDSVWGQLVFKAADDQEDLRPFRYYLADNELIVEEGDDERRIKLDEMGVPITERA